MGKKDRVKAEIERLVDDFLDENIYDWSWDVLAKGLLKRYGSGKRHRSEISELIYMIVDNLETDEAHDFVSVNIIKPSIDALKGKGSH
jgi:uncharacterized membrane-anchored protein YjiN (DUF445 family)